MNSKDEPWERDGRCPSYVDCQGYQVNWPAMICSFYHTVVSSLERRAMKVVQKIRKCHCRSYAMPTWIAKACRTWKRLHIWCNHIWSRIMVNKFNEWIKNSESCKDYHIVQRFRPFTEENGEYAKHYHILATSKFRQCFPEFFRIFR